MKTKEIVIFDPGSIELTITGAIKKNTLPKVRGEWAAWLDSFNAATLETDSDFADAAKFVTECKRVEERLAGIREDALKGKIFEAIKELEVMGETTRQKRLEFDRAVTQRKDRVKADAIAAAMLKIRTGLVAIKHRCDALDIEGEIRTAIKGKSAILKMNEAMEETCARLLSEARTFSEHFEALRTEVAGVYQIAGETATDSELDMIVRQYADGAPERAKFILDQKKVKRDQDELERKRREAEAAAAPKVEAPAQTHPETMAEALAASALPRQMSQRVKTLRFGATFDTLSTDETIARIQAIGGRDVKFVEPKK